MRRPGAPRPARLALLLLATTGVDALDMVPRWGHAAIYLPSPPSLLVHGGKTPSSSTNSYAASPNSPDTFLLPLSSAFTSSASAPWEALAVSLSPAYAFHTLSRVSDNTTLLFGGHGGTSTPLPAGTDSAWLLSIDPPSLAFTQQASTWARQPPRSIHHAAVSTADGSGSVLIIGGQRNDGSGRMLADVHVFNPASGSGSGSGSGAPAFSSLAPLPLGLAHHSAVMLPNGTLVVLAGIQVSANTGNPALSPLTQLYAMDTGASSTSWRTVQLPEGPEARRGQAAFMAGNELVIMGGADLARTSARAEAWRLNLDTLSWTRLTDSPNSARFDFTATPVGNNQIAVFGGYASSGPASPAVQFYNTVSDSWSTSFALAPAPAPSPSLGSPSPSSGSGSPDGGASPSSNAAPDPASTPITGHGPTDPTATPGPGSDPTDPNAPTPNPGGGADGSMSKGAQAGMAVGIIAGASLLGMLLFLCVRTRRRRRLGVHGADGNGHGGGGGGEKGLLSEWSEKGGIVGLGLGAMSAGWSRVGTFRQANEDPYRALAEDGLYGAPAPVRQAGDPGRKSRRKIGHGIRLVGPRPLGSRREDRDRGVRSPPRVDMLHDEDSRLFAREDARGDEWRRQSRSEWAPASRVLRNDNQGDSDSGLSQNDSDDDDGEVLLLPPRIAGGPVPTPLASMSNIDPFDDSRSVDIASLPSFRSGRSARSARSGRSERYLYAQAGPGLHQLDLPHVGQTDFSDLLAVPARYSLHADTDVSLPRSQRSHRTEQSRGSRGSTYLTHEPSDAEDGEMHVAARGHAQMASIVSPDPDEGRPVRRSESFLRKMAAGGIAGLLGRGVGSGSGSGSGSRGAPLGGGRTGWDMDLDVRDDRPQPALWPVESRGTDGGGVSGDGGSRPPSAWTGAGGAGTGGRGSHSKGPSVSSLASAKSMRDMVVVQRETTEGSEGDLGVMDAATPPPPLPLPAVRVGDAALRGREEEEEEEGYEDEDGAGLLMPAAPGLSGKRIVTPPAGHMPLSAGQPKPRAQDGVRSPLRPSPAVALSAASSAAPEAQSSKPRINISTLSLADTPPTRSKGGLAPSLDKGPGPTPTTPTRTIRAVPSSPLSTRRGHSAASPPYTPRAGTHTGTGAPSPPEGSPLPRAILSHRRPVREMVSSINKRASVCSLVGGLGAELAALGPGSGADAAGQGAGAGAGAGLFSPGSVYSGASPAASPARLRGAEEGVRGGDLFGSGGAPVFPEPQSQGKGKGTSWEVRRRESLVVANPGPGTSAGAGAGRGQGPRTTKALAQQDTCLALQVNDFDTTLRLDDWDDA